ncbi:MAG: hypothetical protein ABI551_22935 [Polyangiaceae bacterium]
MKSSSCVAASIAACLVLTLTACAKPKPAAELESGLESPDPRVRRSSADDLRDGPVPAEAIPRLYAAMAKEHDAEAYGAMLITLGASGDLAAKPYVCGDAGGKGIDDERIARWQSHALTAWLHKNPDQGGCSMSSIEEVPASEGPSPTKTKPVKPKAGMFSEGM